MPEPICSKQSPPRPQHPIFSVFRQGGLQFEHSVQRTHRQTGEITTIDPRHADDTPTETFYGSNSPPPGAGCRWPGQCVRDPDRAHHRLARTFRNV